MAENNIDTSLNFYVNDVQIKQLNKDINKLSGSLKRVKSYFFKFDRLHTGPTAIHQKDVTS